MNTVAAEARGVARRRRPVAVGVFVALAALMVWLSSALAVVWWSARDAAGPADAIVVLGAAQYAGRPSPVLKARLDHAVDLWRRGLAARIIVTGGMGKGDTTSEAAVSRRYAMRAGIAESAILLEDRGRTTAASLEAVGDIMRELRIERAILVSDPFHMLRLQILARQQGIMALTSPTRTSPISASRSQALGYFLGESVKVPVILVQGMLRG